LLLIIPLFNSFDEFLGQLECVDRTEKELIEPIVPMNCVDAFQLRRMIVEEKLSLSQASAHLGVSVTTLSVEADKYCIPLQRKRPKRKSAKTERLALKFLKRGSDIKEISKKLACSIPHLYRMLRRSPQTRFLRQRSLFRAERRRRRREFIQVLDSNPGVARKKLQLLAQATFAWLYRNDYDWLSMSLPQAKKYVGPTVQVDWKSRDQIAATAIAMSAEKLLRLQGKPIRLSQYTLARAAGVYQLVAYNLPKLPMTKIVLDSYVETVEAYQVRRVYWAAEELRRQTLPVRPWRILKIAGLSRKISPNVQQAINEICFKMIISLDKLSLN